jgi:dipeptidyl aminopeptidase/acylaminoacyl peptidase
MIRRTLLLIAFAPLAFAQITADQTMKTRDLTDPRFSPDGARIAVVVRDPFTARFAARHIWVYNVASREMRQWTASSKSEQSPRWSPDGKTLAFLSDREENDQIWLMPVAGGEAVKLTSGKSAVQSFAWSPDGAQIAYISRDANSEADDKKSKEFDDARVVDANDKLPRLWTVDVASKDGAAKKPRQETKGAWAIREFEWMPDGKRLLIVATDKPSVESHTNRVFTLTLADGGMEQVLAPRGPFGSIRVSPDGKSFAYAGARLDGPSEHDLFICALDSRTPRNVTGAAVDRPATRFEWIGNTEVAVLVQNGFHAELDAVGVKQRRLVADDSVDPASFTVSARGSVAYVAGTAASIPELWIDGRQVSHLNRELEGVAFVKPEFFRYKSFDGASIEAALYRPISTAPASEGQPGPLVVMVHGGPTGAWSNRFDALTQLLVAHGFRVMQPNIRGSVGYGHKFIEANRGDWGGADFKDVMAGVDEMVRRKVADPACLGIYGWSYGGYMAEWAITQTDRFKAAVSGAGLADLATEFGTESSAIYDEWFYGTPYENLAGFQKSSPITYIKNAKTPTLILQGEADTTDPISQSQMLYRGLKRYNVPVEFVVYPREPHGLREEKHLLDRYTRTIGWFEKYLK